MALVGAQFVNAVSPNPVGSLQAYAGASAPTGWLLCDGSAVSRTVYPELFSVLGTTYGAGDGSTTFGLPDLRGRMPIGSGNDGTAANNATRTRGDKGGDTRLQSHGHAFSPETNTAVFSSGGGATGFDAAQTSGSRGYRLLIATVGAHDQAQGSGGNMPPFIVTNYIIKAIPDAPRSGLAYGSTPPVVTALPANPQFGEQVLFYSTTPYAGYQLQQWTGASWTILNDSRGVGAWQSWTPTVAQGATNNIAKTVQYAKYVVLGKTVIANCRLDLTANGTAGSQASISIPSEIATASTNPRVGACHIYDASTAVRYTGQAEFLTSTTLGFVGDWSGNNVWGAAPNLALGTSDQIGFSIMYEIA